MFPLTLAAFVILHLGPSATGLRARVVARIGEGRYRVVFSIVVALSLGALVAVYNALAGQPQDPLNVPLWMPPDWLRWPAAVLEATGYVLGVTGFLTPGPTFAGFEATRLARSDSAIGVLRITRHPFLWGVMLWSAAHLMVSGECFDLMLFGTLGAMGLFGVFSIDRKGRRRAGWNRFAAITSNIPFLAIAQGRNQFVVSEILTWRISVAIMLFVVLTGAGYGVFQRLAVQ